MATLVAFRVWLATTKPLGSTRPRTISTIKGHVQRITYVMKSVGVLSGENCQEFINNLYEKGHSTNYINKYIEALRLWGRFANDESLASLSLLPKQASLKQTFSTETIIALLTMPCPYKRDKRSHYRWSIYFSVLAHSGARPGEIANLTKVDIDVGQGILLIRDSKTHEPRKVPIFAIKDEVAAYVAQCPTHYLFCSRTGRPVNSSEWSEELRYRLKVLGIPQPPGLTAHSFRHTLPSDMLANGANLYDVQDIIGHKSPETTRKYYHNNIEQLKRSMKSFYSLIRKTSSPKDKLAGYAAAIRALGAENDPDFETSVSQDANYITYTIRISHDGQ